ncbi:hypothetical protein ONZ45_g13624 [Pleurotus djamor]|nr:hypothetical protein ONZ45_g13624 [Pleurotus djamor]
MCSPVVTVTLPNFLAYCPTKPETNKHYHDVRTSSLASIRSFNLFTDARQAKFERNDFEYFTAIAHPYANAEGLRLCSDNINLLYVNDTITDHQGFKDSQATCAVLWSTFNNPTDHDGSNYAQFVADFALRYKAASGPESWKRFRTHVGSYLKTMKTEVEGREAHHTLSVKEYLVQRRYNSATMQCFDMVELGLGIDLPPFVYEDKHFLTAYHAAVDMVWLGNDICSYRMERNLGHAEHNVITVYMKELDLNIQAAFDHGGDEFKKLWMLFQSARSTLPSFGPELDVDVRRFLDACLEWVIGMIHWNYETPRYFGDQREVVRLTNTLTL